MAEYGELMEVNREQMTPRTKIWATIAGIAIEAPILGLMGFSFLTSFILVVSTSPLLVIFSPLIMGAASVFAVAIAGFGVAGITAALGLSSFVLVYRSLIKGRETDGAGDGVDKMIQPAEMVTEEEQQQLQHDTEVAGTEDRTEAAEAVKQQQQGRTTSEPVAKVDKIVELFESLNEHPHENENETTTAVTIVTIEVDDESEEHQHDKDRANSGAYLQQNVQRQIPQET